MFIEEREEGLLYIAEAIKGRDIIVVLILFMVSLRDCVIYSVRYACT